MSAPLAVQPFSTRGTCPALSAPMQTGDGLLSRVAFTAALSPTELANLCDLAASYGIGLIDITARGSFQFRGLTAESAVTLEREVLALALPLRKGIAVEVSPLAGSGSEELADPTSIARRISERAMELGLHEKIAAKMSVIVDGGGPVRMDDLLADIRLKAVAYADGIFWRLMLGGAEGKAMVAGVLRPADAFGCVIDLLSHLASQGTDARGRDLGIETVHRICGKRMLDVAEKGSASAGAPRNSALMAVGNVRGQRLWHLKDGLFAAVIAPAFGQVPARSMSGLCRKAFELDVSAVRPGPMHALYFTGSRAACSALLDHAGEAGFVTGDDDPRSSIAVCPGSPACASAFAPVRELAEFAATSCAPMLDGSFTLHLSGCGKGCAYPAPALLAFSGTAIGLAFSYSARVSAPPDSLLPAQDPKAALSRLARLYEKEHKPGENARALFARLGKVAVVEALRQDEK